MLPRHYAIHYLCAHTYIIKNITMKQRIQNKILTRSSKTNVVLFVIQLSLLFDKTESGEPGEPGESGEPSDSTDSTDSTDSMHSDILARSAKINISAVGTTLPILARRAVIFSAKRGPTELAEPTEPTALLVSASMQFSLKFSINLQLGEIQKHKSCEARCAVPKGFELDPILSEAPLQPQGKPIPPIPCTATS